MENILKTGMCILLSSVIVLMIGAIMFGSGIPFGMKLINIGGFSIIVCFIIAGIWGIIAIINQ